MSESVGGMTDWLSNDFVCVCIHMFLSLFHVSSHGSVIYVTMIMIMITNTNRLYTCPQSCDHFKSLVI